MNFFRSGSFHFSDLEFLKILGIFGKLGIFQKLGIFIPGIEIFSKSGDFYSGNFHPEDFGKSHLKTQRKKKISLEEEHID